MKLDYALMRDVLEEIENQTDGFSPQQIEISHDSNQIEKKRAYHFRILIQEWFVDGEVKDVGAKNNPVEWIIFKGLTLQGHKLLDAMGKDNIWEKIKDKATSLGVEGLKQIPSLAINLLLGSSY